GLVPRVGVLAVGDVVGPEARRGQHGADVDAGVGRLHGRHVLEHVVGVLGRPAVIGLAGLVPDRDRAAPRRGVAVRVGLPVGPVGAVAVDLVADLPVLDAVAVGHVGVLDPGGGQRRGAGAVVDGDDRLRPGRLGGGHEVAEAGVRRVVPALGDVGLPVVDIGVGPARVAQRVDPGRLEQAGDGGVVHVAVVDSGVEADGVGRDGAQAGVGVHGHAGRRGRRRGGGGLAA